MTPKEAGRFRHGQPLVRRCLQPDGRIGAVQSGRVLADDELGLRLWLEAGSATVHRATLDGARTRHLPYREELTTPTLLLPGSWRPFRTLIWVPPGAAHSVWWSWDADGHFIGWYVNLETPARRWWGGVDLEDQALDLLVAPDRSWSWKDEDEFDAQTGDPLFWDAEGAARIRAEGKGLAALADHGQFPFDGTWCDIQPDPDWAPTPLPWWWDALHAVEGPGLLTAVRA